MPTILSWGIGAQAQAVHGSGTTNTIPVWTSSTTIGNSLIQQSGSNVNVSGGVKATGPITGPSLGGDGSAVTNVNAAKLAGFPAAAFALVGASNIFTANQTIDGNLTLSGSTNNALTLQGNVTDSNGGQGANMIGGVWRQ